MDSGKWGLRNSLRQSERRAAGRFAPVTGVLQRVGPSAVLRRAVLAAAGDDRLRELVTAAPVSAAIVQRFVAGPDRSAAMSAVAALCARGLDVSLDHLGEDTVDPGSATAAVAAYTGLLGELARTGLAQRVEVSVKLSALGLALADDGPGRALAGAREICSAARNAGTTVTVDMEDSTLTEAILGIVEELRADFPDTAAVIQAYLRRSAEDCAVLAAQGARVRLCKGAYNEPPEVAYTSRAEVDRSYVRCLSRLMAGTGRPLVATHDPRLIAIADALAVRTGRGPGDWEYQMLYGIRPAEQRRLVASGFRVRVYTPFGAQWWGYLVRRLAERPANLAFFARSLVGRS